MSEDFDKVAAALPELELSSAVRQRHLAAFVLLTQPTATAQSTTTTRPPRTVQLARPRRRLTLGIAAGVVAGALGFGAAASLGVFDAPVTDRGTAHCYTTADLGRADNHNDFGVAVSPDDPDAIADAAEQATAICSSQWAIGRFSTATATFPVSASGPADHPVPPLVACVLSNGEVAIFPGPPRTCASIGLANAIL
ncbi:hypothetical protein ABIB25_005750 [Nakamurella sp. UYEF19]|uniref:hypothetical protein n=1 Tax=Nakamurella sp. UYEF19 TaxID=1756392 RepID=UPI0033953FDA